MADLLDYLDWRGDVPFGISPFNEVDNYIVSQLSSLDLTGIVSADGEPVSIGEAVRAYRERYGRDGDRLGLLSSANTVPMVKRLPATARFRGLKLSRFVKRAVPENTEQFAAVTVTLPNGTHYIAFRGTDDTINAWKEDFLLAVEDRICAQRDAAAYLEQVAAATQGPLMTGGHSKGGNLAVFAAAQAPEAVQTRIRAVYNNDGPGFFRTFFDEPGYLRIKPKVRTILPQYSMVGTLLTQDENYTVVKCSARGIAAHDGFTWQVKGTRFVRCSSLSRRSLVFDSAMDSTLEDMTIEERRAFIDEFFGALSATGAVTLTDMTEHKLRKALSLVRTIGGRESKTRRLALLVLEQMLAEYTHGKLKLK